MSARISITAKQAAALDRLLDAYLATEEDAPGLADLAALRQKTMRLPHDHSAWDATLSAPVQAAEEVGDDVDN